jgi:phage terminase large subunit
LIKLNSKYEPLFKDETRFFIITGGRGSSKSFGVGTFANLLSFESGHRILFTRQTMTSAHLSIIPEFQKKIDILGKRDEVKVSGNIVKSTDTGSVIIFSGINVSLKISDNKIFLPLIYPCISIQELYVCIGLSSSINSHFIK